MTTYTIKNTSAIGRPVKVFLNGNEIDHVFYADDEKGEVKAYDYPLRLAENSEELAYQTMYGDVRVEALPPEVRK